MKIRLGYFLLFCNWVIFKDLIFFYLTHTAHVLKRGLCDVTQVEENVFEDSFELCFMTANCTNQILLISLMRMKSSQQMEFFRQVKCAWCESYGHWWRHYLSSLILHNCMVSMENHQEFNFKLLMITYILHGCNTMMRISEGNTVCYLSLFKFNCYLQFWVDTNVLLCWFCGPCWCFDEDAFVQSTHIYLWIKFIKLHSASKAFREYRIGL